MSDNTLDHALARLQSAVLRARPHVHAIEGDSITDQAITVIDVLIEHDRERRQLLEAEQRGLQQTADSLAFNEHRFTGGTGAEIIDAILHALRLNGVEKLAGKGWSVTGEEELTEFPLLVNALEYRIRQGGVAPSPVAVGEPADITNARACIEQWRREYEQLLNALDAYDARALTAPSPVPAITEAMVEAAISEYDCARANKWFPEAAMRSALEHALAAADGQRGEG
jgi:hypothetical protein